MLWQLEGLTFQLSSPSECVHDLGIDPFPPGLSLLGRSMCGHPPCVLPKVASITS